MDFGRHFGRQGLRFFETSLQGVDNFVETSMRTVWTGQLLRLIAEFMTQGDIVFTQIFRQALQVIHEIHELAIAIVFEMDLIVQRQSNEAFHGLGIQINRVGVPSTSTAATLSSHVFTSGAAVGRSSFLPYTGTWTATSFARFLLIGHGVATVTAAVVQWRCHIRIATGTGTGTGTGTRRTKQIGRRQQQASKTASSLVGLVVIIRER